VIRGLAADDAVASAGKLADVLLDCIAGGASAATSIFFKVLR
jgi:hypothetical protein